MESFNEMKSDSDSVLSREGKMLMKSSDIIPTMPTNLSDYVSVHSQFCFAIAESVFSHCGLGLPPCSLFCCVLML